MYVRCLNSRNICDISVCQTLFKSDVNMMGSKGLTFFFRYILFVCMKFLVLTYSFSRILKTLYPFKWLLFSPAPQILSGHELHHPVSGCPFLPSGFSGIFSQLEESWRVINFLVRTLLYHRQLYTFHSSICIYTLQK